MKPEDGHIYYIINPTSGAGSEGKLPGKQFKDYLEGKGFDVRINFTHGPGHAADLAAEAAGDSGCSLVVVVGGDGTVREAACGLAGSNRTLLIIPGGTENLLANELGLDKNVETLIRTFETGVIKPFDLGSANGKCFTSIMGFGFDGEVVKRVSERRGGHINYFDYFWPLWRTFWQYKFEPMDVVLDDKQIFEDRGLVFVGNISRYAVGLNILGRADFSDGLLDVCIYRCGSHVHLLRHSVLTVVKQHSRDNDVIYRQGKNVRISSNCTGIPSEIDGDVGPALPVEIKIRPGAMKVLIPPGGHPAGIREQILRALKKSSQGKE